MPTELSYWLIFAISIPALSFMTFASSDKQRLNSYLHRFEKNSSRAMQELPEKRDKDGDVVANPESLFSKEAIRTGDYIDNRDKIRRELMIESGEMETISDNPGSEAAFQPNDNPRDIVDTDTLVRSPWRMEAKGLHSARLNQAPWSDSYWPMYQGMIAARYADGGFPGSKKWEVNYRYIQKRPAHLFSAPGSSGLTRQLSPAEKYEFLVGDSSHSLTRYLWDRGRYYKNKYGSVSKWMGICHGWAAASFMERMPKRSIKLLSAKGRKSITFYPADIKGLASLLWAETNPETRFIGGRCNVHGPRRDVNGRIINEECFDTNPGTWHLAVTNQIGRANRSFIMDVTYDHQVWNQPVYSYEYRYFNPKTLAAVDELNEAIIPISQFSDDRFDEYRAEDAKWVVGVSMDVTYVKTRSPVARNSTTRDPRLREVTYVYDLELNAKHEIIGGEWYNNNHPDFLWNYKSSLEPPTKGDEALKSVGKKWYGIHTLPESWQQAAQKSAEEGHPLNHIIHRLIQLSN